MEQVFNFMKFLGNITQKKMNTTLGFSFGKPESEGENSYRESLQSPFDDYLNVLPAINNGHFIIVGRKGSGKSAIAKYIKDNACEENGCYCEIIKTDSIKLEQQIQGENQGLTEFIVAFFQWLILVKLVKLIIASSHGEYTQEIKALRNFVRNNSGVVEVDKFSITEINILNNTNINVGALGNVGIFRAILERALGKRFEKAPFYKILPALKEIVYKVLHFEDFKDLSFFVIFDDLDINFKADNLHDKLFIMNLIRVARDINNDLRETNNTSVLIFLRDDIKKLLEGIVADTNKIFSTYAVELKWYDHHGYKNRETDTILRKFINKRIAQNFKKFNIPFLAADPWCSLFANNEDCYGSKTAFKYILDYTFYRPRDLILLCNHIGEYAYYFPIKGKTVKQLIHKYTIDNVKEIKDELAIYHSYSQDIVAKIFALLKALTSYQYSGFSKEAINTKLQECGLGREILSLLIEYSLIIPYDAQTGKYYIKYRETNIDDFVIEDGSIQYKLHNSIYAYYVPDSIKLIE